MNKSSVSCTQKSSYSQILYCALERWTRPQSQTLHGKTDWRGSKVHRNTKLLDRIDGEPMEFEWNIFPEFTTLELCTKVQELLSKLSATPEKITWRSIFMSMFNDIKWWSEDNKKEWESSAQFVSLYPKRFGAGHGHFSGLDQWKSCIQFVKTVHKVNGKIAEKMTITFAKAHTQSSDPRVHCPEERFLARQSDPLFLPSVMKIHTLLTDDPAQEEDLLQRYQERVERLSQQDRVIKFCTDAGFLTVVEIGQYFMTKDTEEFSQFTDSVACSEYTLEVTTNYLQCKYGVEIRLESSNKDNSHSWSEFLMVWISWSRTRATRRTTTTSRKPLRWSLKIMFWKRMYLLLQADQKLKENHKDVFLPTHPRKLYLNHKIIRQSMIQSVSKQLSTLLRHGRTVPIGERTWTDVEPGKQSLSDYSVSKKLIDSSSSPWKSTSRRWWSDWILENKKIIFRTISGNLNIGLTRSGRAQWQNAEETRKNFNIVLIHQDKKFFISELFKVIQDAISFILLYRTMSRFRTISSVHLSCQMCNQFTFHHEFRTDSGRLEFEQTTDSILYACGSYEQRTQRSWDDRFGSTASCTISADSVE